MYPPILAGSGRLALDGPFAEALLAHSPFSTVVYDSNGRLALVNPAFERLWGVSMASAPANYSVLTDPELERAGLIPLIRRAFRGEPVITPPVRYDISAVSRNGAGRAVWTQGHFSPILDGAGRVAYVILTHIDLTDRIEAEQALRQQAERLRLAQRAARIGTFDWHIPSGRVAWTEEQERLFGLAPGSFSGTIQGWESFLLPDDLARMQGELGECMDRRGRDVDFAFRIRRTDGEIRSIAGSAEFFYAGDGTPLRMVGVNVDVTDRVRSSDEQRRSAELLRETERIAQIGSWEWDVETGTLVWSDELYSLYGIERGAAMSFERFLAALHPDDRAFVQRTVERALGDGEPFDFDHRIIRPDGGVRYLHGRGRVITDAGGRPVRMIGSGQDITERKATEDALRRAKEEAEAASRAKSDFLAVMSHELRTPLNAIAGYAELIELGVRGPVTPQQRADLRRIKESQRHLLGLINEVLNYSRVEAGAVHYDIGEVSVAALVAAAEALIVPQASAREIDLVVGPIDPDLVARADGEKLQQVLLNLLTNAVKFTPAGGSISLGAARRGERVVIEVRDTGIGIPAEKLDRIFEPFVQVGRSLDHPVEGVGLGLAISRDLAQGMGGDLSVESTVGAGSCFTLLLPAAELPVTPDGSR